ncbi:hypothetical protein, partial [Desulfococcus sp.]|uniref:hypothetical protein n=1 Tax=Desulfococcus sp. TaxID=2025834 RepID=UPI0035934B3F
MMVLWRKNLNVVSAVLALLSLSAGLSRAETGIWETAVPSRAFILRAVWGHSPEGVFAVGDAGRILHFDGSAWRTLASGTDRDLAAVWGSGPARVFAAGRDG